MTALLAAAAALLALLYLGSYVIYAEVRHERRSFSRRLAELTEQPHSVTYDQEGSSHDRS